MSKRRYLTPKQTDDLNRVLRHLAHDLELKKAERERFVEAHARLPLHEDVEAEQLAIAVGDLTDELARCAD